MRAATGRTVRPVVVALPELRKIIDRLKREQNDLAEVAESLRESLRAEAAPAASEPGEHNMRVRPVRPAW